MVQAQHHKAAYIPNLIIGVCGREMEKVGKIMRRLHKGSSPLPPWYIKFTKFKSNPNQRGSGYRLEEQEEVAAGLLETCQAADVRMGVSFSELQACVACTKVTQCSHHVPFQPLLPDNS